MSTPHRYDPLPGTVGMTHVVYGLHAFTLVTSLPASVFFPFGLTIGAASVVGIIINYVLSDDVRGTWLETHFELQKRIFWRALGGILLLYFLSVPLLIFGPLGLAMLWGGGIVLVVWFGWKIFSGWRALFAHELVPL